MAIASGGVAALALYASFTVSAVELVYVAIMSVVSYLMARTSMIRIAVTPTGIRIVNPIRTTFVPWEHYLGFAVESWRGWRNSVVVRRRDSRPAPVFVFASNPMYEDARVPGIVEELNEMAGAGSRPQ